MMTLLRLQSLPKMVILIALSAQRPAQTHRAVMTYKL